jgi:hypothetical protein
MKHRFFARTAIAIAATAIASLGVAATTAQAATVGNPHVSHSAVKVEKLGASPRFLCDDFAPAVCVFQGSNWSGTADAFPTGADSEQWINLTSGTALSLPWGSFNDDSGSSVVFGDAQTGNEVCFLPHTRISEPANVIHYRYMWIEFGNTHCSGSVGPLP